MDKTFQANYTAGEYLDAATSWLPQQFNVTAPVRMFLAWIPQIIKPGFMTVAGIKDYPRVAPLESQTMQNRLPENRFTPSTSPVSKELGKLLGLSPIKIDYLLTGYLGRSIGFLTGKPGIYNPFSSMNMDYYFESGRKLQNYYDLKQTNSRQYSDYKNKRIQLSQPEVLNMLKTKAKLKQVDSLLQTYKDLNPDKQPKTMNIFRNKIIKIINSL